MPTKAISDVDGLVWLLLRSCPIVVVASDDDATGVKYERRYYGRGRNSSNNNNNKFYRVKVEVQSGREIEADGDGMRRDK